MATRKVPTRFPKGISTAAKGLVFGEFGNPSPRDYCTYFQDFVSGAEFNNITATTSWAVNATGTGTFALTDGDGGQALITNAAADDDRLFFQKKGECFLFETGKQMWFDARFKVSDATQSDIILGLQITDTTPLAVSDGVYFYKADGAATADFIVTKASTATTNSAVATVVSATFIRLGFYYNGASNIDYFVDGVRKGSSVTTNLPTTEELTVSFGLQNGEAVAKTMTIDYIFAAKER